MINSFEIVSGDFKVKYISNDANIGEDSRMIAELALLCSNPTFEGSDSVVYKCLSGNELFSKITDSMVRRVHKKLDHESRSVLLQVICGAHPLLPNVSLKFPYSPYMLSPVFGGQAVFPVSRHKDSLCAIEGVMSSVNLSISKEDVDFSDNYVSCDQETLQLMFGDPRHVLTYIIICHECQPFIAELTGLDVKKKKCGPCVDKVVYRSKGLNDVLRCKVDGDFVNGKGCCTMDINSLGYKVYSKTFKVKHNKTLYPVNLEIQTTVKVGRGVAPDHLAYEISRLEFSDQFVSFYSVPHKFVDGRKYRFDHSKITVLSEQHEIKGKVTNDSISHRKSSCILL
jgi:hypothetical protein